MFDHVILPLISLANVYRKQVKTQESVIKAKENEVYEALEILELSGINHRNRRRATEPYHKGAAETKVQSVTTKENVDVMICDCPSKKRDRTKTDTPSSL